MWFLSSFCSFFSFLFVLSSPHSHPFCRSRSVSLTYTHIYTFPLPIFLIFLRTEQLGTWHWFPSAFGNNLAVAQATHIYLFCILVRVFSSVRERMWNGDDKCAQVGQRAVMHVRKEKTTVICRNMSCSTPPYGCNGSLLMLRFSLRC